MQKHASFKNASGDVLSVAYKIFDKNKCVFTAEYLATQGSSMDYAAVIVVAIAEQEKRALESLRFFDLQTRKSYVGRMKPNPGDFEFDEVIPKQVSRASTRISVELWLLAKCPDRVINAFKEFFDGDPRQIISGNPETIF